MTDFAIATTLRALTPGMYDRLSRREQRLADKYFPQYAASIGKARPTDVTDDVYHAAQQAYERGKQLLLSVGNVFLLLAPILIVLSDGRLWLWGPAICVFALYGFVVGFVWQRTMLMDRYFISQKGAKTGLVASWHEQTRFVKILGGTSLTLGAIVLLAEILGNVGGIGRNVFGTMFLITVPEGIVVYYVFAHRARKQDGGSAPTWLSDRDARQ